MNEIICSLTIFSSRSVQQRLLINMFRLLAALGFVASVIAAPVNIKVSSSGKAYASANLLSALKEEVASAAAQEIDFFLRELGQKTSFLKTVPDATIIRNTL